MWYPLTQMVCPDCAALVYIEMQDRAGSATGMAMRLAEHKDSRDAAADAEAQRACPASLCDLAITRGPDGPQNAAAREEYERADARYLFERTAADIAASGWGGAVVRLPPKKASQIRLMLSHRVIEGGAGSGALGSEGGDDVAFSVNGVTFVAAVRQ